MILLALRSLTRNVSRHWPRLSFISSASSLRHFSQTSSFVLDRTVLLRFAYDFEQPGIDSTAGAQDEGLEDVMGKSKGAFYAVQKGRQKGVYTSWTECEVQVKGFAGSVFKRFGSRAEAQAFSQAGNGYNGSAGGPASTLDAPSGSNYKQARRARSAQKATSNGVRPAPNLAQTSASAKTLRHAVPNQPSPQLPSVFPSASADQIIAYCDGSSIGNGKQGARAGWGVYFENPHMQHMNESRRLPGELQTNNRAELMALIRGIHLCYQVPGNKGRQLLLLTDSQYSMDCVEKWIKAWKKSQWKTKNGTDVSNRDLIEILDSELQKYYPRPKLVKVKGHSGIEGNDIVDRMAKFGATLPKSDSADFNLRSSAPECHLNIKEIIDLTDDVIDLTDD